MRILVLGAGGVGGYFGGRLAAGGVDVTFLVRARRAAELARDGLVLRSPLGDLQIEVEAVERVDESFDVVILSCKSYDLEGAMAAIAPAVGRGALVLPLLNGFRHLDALDARFGPQRVLGGCCHIGVTLSADGAIEHLNAIARFIYGPRAKEQEARCDALLAELSRGGFAPVLSADIERELWEKFAFLTTYAGLTCLMRASIGAVAETDDGAAIAAELLGECGAVAAASGFPLRPEFLAQSHAAVTERGSAGTSSMLRDLLRGGPTEHDHILGDMLTRARAQNVAAPILRVARAHMQAYEATRRALATGNDALELKDGGGSKA